MDVMLLDLNQKLHRIVSSKAFLFAENLISSWMVSNVFHMSGMLLEQFCTERFNEWQKQCIYKALGYSADILACTPDSLPLMLDAPSYPCPLQSFKSSPNRLTTSLMIMVSESVVVFYVSYRSQLTPHALQEY